MPAEGPQRQAPWEEIEAEARSLLALAEDAGLTMRVVGSTGVRMHCTDASSAMDKCGRPPKDIDLIARSKERKQLRRLLEARGYELDRDVLVAMEGARYCCTHPETGIEVDVFFDRLEFCHTIELSDRLTRHPETIPIEDLLLQKLQVHELTLSDNFDAAVALAAHEVSAGTSDPERLDADYVASVLAQDWGFHRTATENLVKIEKASIEGAHPGLDDETVRRITAHAAELRDAIEAAPKSLSWRLRARVGERVQWWNDVSERELTY